MGSARLGGVAAALRGAELAFFRFGHGGTVIGGQRPRGAETPISIAR